jgi:hypothetical protein
LLPGVFAAQDQRVLQAPFELPILLDLNGKGGQNRSSFGVVRRFFQEAVRVYGSRPSHAGAFDIRSATLERIFSWIDRNRMMSKDYERKVQTSECLTNVAMIQITLGQLARTA